MPIYARESEGGGEFIPAPAGQHRAVCVDIIEKENVQTQHGLKHRVGVVFQTEARGDDGEPYSFSAWHNLTLGGADKPSNLRRFLESWRGRPFTKDERQQFDVEVLIGANATVQLVHVESGGKIYCNVQAIMLPPKGVPALEPINYTRYKDRDDRPVEAPMATASAAKGPFDDFPEALEQEDDDLPF